MPEPLTALERQVYQFMIDFLAENTYQPSLREIGRKFRIKSTKSVSDVLQGLAAKGYIQRDHARSRGVRLLGYAGSSAVQPVPYYAKLETSGEPLRAENRAGFLTVDRRFLPTEDVYFVRAGDAAMTDRGILEDDYVLVCPVTRADEGEMVAVRLADQVLVRTLSRRGAHVLLEASQDGAPALELGPADDYAVLGTVAGVFRPFVEQTAVALVAGGAEAAAVS